VQRDTYLADGVQLQGIVAYQLDCVDSSLGVEHECEIETAEGGEYKKGTWHFKWIWEADEREIFALRRP